MNATFLKAGNGDAILLKHGKHNILIDGGNESHHLLEQVKSIFERNEVLDLLIITHHDDDHIKGIIDLLKMISDPVYEGKRNDLIRKVLFNSPRQQKIQSDSNQLTYRQAYEVEELLLKNKITWDKCTEYSDSLTFENLTLTFLSPTERDVQDYIENQGAYLASDFRCDWNSPIHSLEKFVNDDSQDNSLYNLSSIVVLCECDGKKILLPGDVTPKRLAVIINNLKKQNNEDLVKLDLMALPHHGSYRNINETIIQNIKCTNFITSTNSRKHFLPNKRAILKILKHLNREQHEQIHFYFNYQEALSNLNISETEKKKYNFSTSPNNKEYGIVL